MQPAQANQFDITDSIHRADLHRSGFSKLLTESVAEALGTTLALNDLGSVRVSVLCKLGGSEPLYLFEVDVAEDAKTLRPPLHGLPLRLRENLMQFPHRAALWRAAPSLAPGGAASRGDHSPVETGEDLLVQKHVQGSMPSGHRPLLVRFFSAAERTGY